MNIVLFGEVSIASILGGAERVLREQALGLQRRGHSVAVIARAPKGDPREDIIVDGIREYRYRVSTGNEATFVLSTIRRSVQCLDRIREDRSIDIGIIHQSLAGIGPILFRTSQIRRWLYVCHSLAHEEFLTRVHPGTHFSHRARYRLNVQTRCIIERTVMRRCSRVIVLSDFMRERVKVSHEISESCIRKVAGAADPEKFFPSRDKLQVREELGLPQHKFIVFTVRNLVPRMGLETLIQAVAAVEKFAQHMFLEIGGEGPLRPKLQALVDLLGLKDRIRLVGYIPENRLPKYYQASDLVVMPTQQLEGFGLVTVEALASGTPVLGTPVGAIPEILSQIDPMFLAKGADAPSLTVALTNILQRFHDNPSEQVRLSRKGRELVEQKYSWEHHASQLTKILEEFGYSAAA